MANPFCRPKAADVGLASQGHGYEYAMLPGKPSVRVSHEAAPLVDVLDMVKAWTPGEERTTVSTMYNGSVKELSAAFDAVNALRTGVHEHVDVSDMFKHSTVNAHIDAIADKTKRKQAKRHLMLMGSLPPTDVGWRKYPSDKGGPRLYAPLEWAKTFVQTYVQTATTLLFKAELVREHTLNEAATTEHVLAMAQRNVEMNGSGAQEVALAGTGVAPDAIGSTAAAAVAASIAAPAAQPAVAASAGDVTVGNATSDLMAIVNAMAPGPRREDAIEKAFEMAVSKMMDIKEHEQNVKYELELRSHEAEQKRQDAIFEERIVAIRRESHQKDLLFKQNTEASQAAKKKRKMEELESTIASTTDEHVRQVAEEKLAMLANMPTTTSLIVNTEKTEKPMRLVQHVLESGDSTLEYRLPPSTSIYDFTHEERLTLCEYVQRVYPRAQLSKEDYVTLGGIVARAAEKTTMPGANVHTHRSVNGERFKARAYFARDLTTPPLEDIIDKFVRENANGAAAKTKRRRLDDDISMANSMDSFLTGRVAVGRPV